MRTVTVKMSDEAFARLEGEARRLNLSKAALLRESLQRNLDNRPRSLADKMADLIGSVDGPADLSTNPDYMRDYGREGAR